MKIKTRKLIAAITATALLGSALGISAYAIDKTKNDFGFKGTYDLTAFAAASETKTNVMGVDIDVTNTLTITSEEDANTDGKGDYTLFLTVVDTSDMASLNGIKVGYKIGDTYYNGTTSGLSNVMYNGLTLRVGEDSYETIKAADYKMTNSVNNGTAIPYFVITEVETAKLGENTATLTIEADTRSYSKSFTKSSDTASNYFNISGSVQSVGTDSLTYNGTTYEYAFKTEGSTYIEFNLTKPGKLTLLVGSRGTGTAGIAVDGTAATLNGNLVSMDLLAGTHKINKGAADQSWLFYINVDTAGEVSPYTAVAEVPATCGKDGTEAHYESSNGKLYQKDSEGNYTEVTAADLVISATGEHTVTDETWDKDDVGHWHVCSVCEGKADYAEHTDTNTDGSCDVCGKAIVTATDIDIKDTSGNTVGSVKVYGENDTINYEDLVKSITVNDGYVVSKITVDGNDYTSGDITINSTSTIVATINLYSYLTCGASEYSSNTVISNLTDSNNLVTVNSGSAKYRNRNKTNVINGITCYGWQCQTKVGDILSITAGSKAVTVTIHFNGMADGGDFKACNLTYVESAGGTSKTASTTGDITTITLTIEAGATATISGASGNANKPTFWLIEITPVSSAS